ncbi:RelA/SpoT domain-containing protein [Inediibacterium massiliense]|uniref:RelA/SpoT domain-containing protein n=1 Tax=Inediibacterium massiliense TaxID=1658111 RepID=UPI0006B58B93|nr:RelA/SpoT domain-containing protein [Inediibacterium massiliense]
MDIVKKFMKKYKKKFMYYQRLAEYCCTKCEEQLSKNGIHSIVSFRGKNPRSLEKKIEYRMKENQYHSIEEISKDIRDLAGVRIALYFPGDAQEVEKVILSEFILVEEPSRFDGSYLKYDKRFAGYRANHYKVKLKENILIENIPYQSEIIEIQVASVLMHAWAEVEHDLAYKVPDGGISDMEYALLAQLNGLVHSGEVTLEQLQIALNKRLESEERHFLNHYELSSYISTNLSEKIKNKITEPTLGRVDLLFGILKQLNMNKPSDLRKYLKLVETEIQDRPICFQLIEKILGENKEKYFSVYEDFSKRLNEEVNNVFNNEFEIDYKKSKFLIDEFLLKWVQLQSKIRNDLKIQEIDMVKIQTMVEEYFEQKQSIYKKIQEMSQMRNDIINGIIIPSEEDLKDAIEYLEDLLEGRLEEKKKVI